MKQATTPTISISLKGQGSMLLDALNQTGGITVFIKNESGWNIRATRDTHYFSSAINVNLSDGNKSRDSIPATMVSTSDSVKVTLVPEEATELIGNNMIEMTVKYKGKVYKTATRKFVVEPALWKE